MKTKLFELRDRATFIPIICVYCGRDYDEISNFLLARCGYGYGCNILMTALVGGKKAHCDPYDWADRTYQVAHLYIIQHWDELINGQVIDVEFILGETTSPKISERVE